MLTSVGLFVCQLYHWNICIPPWIKLQSASSISVEGVCSSVSVLGKRLDGNVRIYSFFIFPDKKERAIW